MAEQDVATVARKWLDAFNASDWDLVKAGLTPDSVYDEFGTQRHIEGSQAIIEVLQNWKSAMPDVKGRVQNVLTNGDSAIWTSNKAQKKTSSRTARTATAKPKRKRAPAR